jgi:hypothetical protein
MHERYEEWLDYLFDHEVTASAWHWAADAPVFEASELDYAVLIGETFRRAGRDLLRFSDAQLNQGLLLLASAACSDYMAAIKDARIPMATRLATIRSVYDLYRDCFQLRCTETLSHCNRTGRSALNEICYMFWDISVLGCLEENDEERPLVDCVFSVLGDTLKIPHLACQEAAIHGYGEISLFHPRRVEEALDAFLAGGISSGPLRAYAENARSGNIL